jgi:CRISPR-associated protein Cmr6
MGLTYPLPGDTQQVLRRFRLTQCRNPGLLFGRYAPDWQADATVKKTGLEAIRDTRLDVDLLRAFRERWRTVVVSQQADLFEAVTDWRLIVGLGQKGPLEVGFTFHRLYGIPVIPGSALKGLARAYARLVEERGDTDRDFRAIFGRAPEPGEDQTQAQAGEGIFFDAIPVNAPNLDLDVMNPHYPDYYQGNAPPANWQSPKPIYFLTLQPGIRFAFAVGWRKPLDGESRRRRAMAVAWLRAGLQELGAGAKTAAGYGYFRSPEEVR